MTELADFHDSEMKTGQKLSKSESSNAFCTIKLKVSAIRFL